MGYPLRYFQPGYVWHLTIRCHDRIFLLDVAWYRKLLVDTLFEAQERYQVPVLNFTVTSNHIHILVLCPEDKTAIPCMMRLLGSKVGATYNKKSGRQGAFWQKRYHATAVETGEHLVRCSLYIDLNMVRAGVVSHPEAWKHGGYHEIVKPKQRYKLINREELMRLMDMPDDPKFSKHYANRINATIKRGNLSRDNVWTKEVAVGKRSFVEKIRKKLGFTSRLPDDSPAICEDLAGYGEQIPENALEWDLEELNAIF
jgi:putative transposase